MVHPAYKNGNLVDLTSGKYLYELINDIKAKFNISSFSSYK